MVFLLVTIFPEEYVLQLLWFVWIHIVQYFYILCFNCIYQYICYFIFCPKQIIFLENDINILIFDHILHNIDVPRSHILTTSVLYLKLKEYIMLLYIINYISLYYTFINI